MRFVRIIEGYDHLWAVKEPGKECDELTALELEKMNRCKSYLKANGVFDQDSFIDLSLEEQK